MDLKSQLAQEGFDTTYITPELLKQLENEGYDTSSLSYSVDAANTAKNAVPDWMNEPGLQNVSLTPITKPDLEQAGVDIAESKFGQKNPNLGAFMGTGVQMADDLALALASGFGGNAAVQGTKLGRVISGPSRQAAGEAIGAAEQMAGIKQTLPELKDLAQQIGIKNGTSRQYVTRLNEMLQNKILDRLPAQKLAEHEEQLSKLLDAEPNGFLGKLMPNTSELGKKGVALASKTRAALQEALNTKVPGRAEALADYAAAKTRGNIYKGTAAAAGTALLGSKVKKVLKTLFGS